jgi:hypothetical protein
MSHGDSLTAAELACLRAIGPQLIFTFWSKKYADIPPFVRQLREQIPGAALAGCSTSGDITAEGANTDSFLLTALRFEHTALRVIEENDIAPGGEETVGARLAAAIAQEGRALDAPVAAVLCLAPGIHFNGSTFIRGMTRNLPDNVRIAGGLSGDHGASVQAFTLGPSGMGERKAVAVALYGKALRMYIHGRGGWRAFGPTRKVTACQGNLLMKLDGKPALELYKRYLGPYAAELPTSALFFPFEVIDNEQASTGVYRTVLGVDEQAQTLSLAGSIELNSYIRLMQAGPDELVTSAEQAGADCMDERSQERVDGQALALLVSCIGRKLMMGDRTDEEILAVGDQLGENVMLAGFYANGEFVPDGKEKRMALNNQTMAVTLLTEIG